MISCRKGARSNVRDEIDMRSPCVCDRILFERRKGDGKEAISSSLLGKVTMKRYQGLQDRDFESINCEQRAQPSSFIVLYVDLVRVWRGGVAVGRRSTLGPRWVIGGSPIFGGHPWVPARKLGNSGSL